MDAATLTIFNHLFASVAEEMGVTLGRAAYSSNIKERLDYSCAVFLAGQPPRLLAQAAHIPVHLGAMPASVRAAVAHCAPFRPGDVVILNDPYLGGNHLPDITLVSPVFFSAQWSVVSGQSTHHPLPTDHYFLVASRAHHADVGGMSPGSMPLSTELYQEGIIIPPIKLIDSGTRNEAVWQLILRNVRTPWEREGDLAAQLAAHTTGAARLAEIVGRYGLNETLGRADALIAYAESLTRAAIRLIPNGVYPFSDYLDDDGRSAEPVPIQVVVTVEDDQLTADFAGTAAAVPGNLNAVPAIVESAVAYCVRCVALALLAAALPHLIPAAGQGTMNNLTFGSLVGRVGNPTSVASHRQAANPSTPLDFPDGRVANPPYAYYETIGGGAGAGPAAGGTSGIHVHMSNTRNTPVEALEAAYPIRVEAYSLRQGSGGRGLHRGGDGLIRAIRFLAPATVTITSERRRRGPYGLNGGEPGAPGRNVLIRQEETAELPGKATLTVEPGDVIRIETPGGGGWGSPTSEVAENL